ncbi:MAG: hypothetical protein KC877_00355 [Candidatus Kaiserbacteria bacterium]|nr:hypothetical protein [Candidatus Kaiserbacteria bacterium]MCB9816002.1 hypothetical protein [Candidatus Nomurabacteria bacterium]
MAEETQQDGQKTLVAFVVGLLIGGMLVWAFSGPDASAPATDNTGSDTEETTRTEDTEKTPETTNNTGNTAAPVVETPVLEVGNGAVSVPDQPASASVTLESATYPVSEGWIGVREYNNDQLGYILGVVRFSESQGLVPEEITLQRSTTAGNRYAVVIFTEDGDFDFSLAGDVQIDQIFDTFIAQ